MSYSVIPALFDRNWWDALDYPSHILDQHFGMALSDSDLLDPEMKMGYPCPIRRRTPSNIGASGRSEVIIDKDKFQVTLDVSQFKPEELDVKMVDNFVVIHGKHEERSDEHGFVSREFTRKYMLPEGVEPDTITSSMSQGGFLTIQAPKKAVEPPPQKERNVAIKME